MSTNRRAYLRGMIVAVGVGLAGCNRRRDSDDNLDGLARIELTNYDNSSHTLVITLRRAAEGENSATEEVVDRTVTLPPPTTQPDGDEAPVVEVISDFPERDGRYVLEWSINGGDTQTFETDEILGCKLIRVEIDADGNVDIFMQNTICYGQDEGTDPVTPPESGDENATPST